MTELTREQVAALIGRWDRVCQIGGVSASAPIRAELDTAAPDLARQLLAAMDRLADADMAQAMLIKRAADELTTFRDIMLRNQAPDWTEADTHMLDGLSSRIRRLAPDAGVKAVAELRADRDRLAADNANLQARFEKLRGVLTFYAPSVSNGIQWAGGDDAGRRAKDALAEDDMLVSALATREAWKGILPGGEG